MGFVVDKMALGQVFLQALWFSLPFIIPPILHSRTSSVAGIEGSFEPTVTGDSALTYNYN